MAEDIYKLLFPIVALCACIDPIKATSTRRFGYIEIHVNVEFDYVNPPCGARKEIKKAHVICSW